MRNILKTLFLLLFLAPLSTAAVLPSVAFFYGYQPPVDQLKAFNAVVVQPSANIDPGKYDSASSQLFAYISAGELEPTSSYASKVPPTWLIGQNSTWKSKVINQNEPKWPQFFVDQIVTPLWEKGYRGFFFDTLDSYQLAVKDQAGRQLQIAGLVKTIQAVKARYPNAKIILNRGFELVPAVHSLIYGVAAESLFSSWDEQKKMYVAVTPSYRATLLNELRKVQAQGVPAISIDYVDPAQRAQAIAVAKQIADQGIIPWVTDGHLQTMGVGAAREAPKIVDIGSATRIPRKIAVIFSKDTYTTAINSLGMPLEYLGFVPEFHDLNTSLPSSIDANHGYAGAILWADPQSEESQNKLARWSLALIQKKTPLVFMGQFGFKLTPRTASELGLILNSAPNEEGVTNLRITQQDKAIVGFETAPRPNKHEFIPLQAKNSRVLLKLSNQQRENQDAIAITPWGGYALAPYVQSTVGGENLRWIINPLRWLPLALHQQEFPILDVTTENGRRMMMGHIDSEGFAWPSDWPLGASSAAALKEKILTKFQVPTTVSITAQDAPELMSIAKSIVNLPWVEKASYKLNGGNTDVSLAKPSLTRIHPMAVKQGSHLQIYAPIASETSYTNGWNQPYYGFNKVIETFKLTDQPYRFKPIDIYYHFFSGSKHASLNALAQVYQWAIAEPTIPFFESEYIAKVQDFYNSTLSRTRDGGWQIDTEGNLREIRIPGKMGYPDLKRSQNIVGYTHVNDNTYVHLGPANRTLLYLTASAPTLPYLQTANGVVKQFQRNNQETNFSVAGHVPLELTLGNMKNCQLWQGNQALVPNSKNPEKYHFEKNVSDDLHVKCS